MIANYFDDMYRVFAQQMWALKPGGWVACVVGNSTFSRRSKRGSEVADETWRLPVLTDVILAHLAVACGFEQVQIWNARELRPRNVRGGTARESLVVARKPLSI
jgi:tetrahydromethanopterin S-methyltransferase subunit E